MKIVVFGDSVAKGIIFQEGKIKTIPDNAVQRIAEHYGIQIDNVSQYGQTLKRLLEKGTVDRYIEACDNEADKYAVIAIGGNDSDYPWNDVAKNPNAHHPAKTPLAEFASLYEEMILKLQSHGFKVAVSTIFPIDSRLFFDNVISKLADPGAILTFMKGDIDVIARHQDVFSVICRYLAEEHNCPVIDIRGRFLQEPNNKKYVCPDGIHPTEDGYRFLAEVALKEIEQSGVLSAWMADACLNVANDHDEVGMTVSEAKNASRRTGGSGIPTRTLS